MKPSTVSMKRNPKSGVALLLVMVSVAFMAVIITEIIAASRVDLLIALNARNRLQASYLAVSSAKLQLLRLHMYKEVRNLRDANSNLPIGSEMIDKIWNVPIPPLPLDASKSKWPGSFQGKIETEGSKIPINLLDGEKHRNSGKEQAEEVRKQLENLINGMLETEEFDEKYRGLDPKDLINPLVDWVDTNNEKVEGGNEDREYQRLDPPYRNRNDRLASLSELHMIQGWTDDLYRRLVPNLSILNNSIEINPNYVPLSRIRAWAPELSSEELSYIDQKRRLTPFNTMEELIAFIQNDPEIRGGKNIKVPESFLKKSSNREIAFMIESTGIVGETRRNLRIGVLLLPEKDTYKKKADGSLDLGPDGKPQIQKKGKLTSPQVVFVEEFI
jgi:general secretion pathway protein K